MKNTVFPHEFWRPFLDCMPQLFFRPQYVWFPVHLKGHLIPLCYETLVVNWQNWLFTLFYQSRSVLSPNPVEWHQPRVVHCQIPQCHMFSLYTCTTFLLFLLAILKSVIWSTHMIRIQRYARNLSKDNFVVDTFTIHDACNCVAYVHFYWVNISILSTINCNFMHSISCGLFGTGSISKAAFWLLRALQCVPIFTSHMLFSLTSDMKTRG